MEREIDPDIVAGADLIQEVRNSEFEDNLSKLSPEIQAKYAAIEQARQILTDAGVPALIFCHAKEESVVQMNNWRDTLYVEKDGKLFVDKMDAAWVQVSLAFMHFLTLRLHVKADLPPLNILQRWFEYCQSSLDNGNNV